MEPFLLFVKSLIIKMKAHTHKPSGLPSQIKKAYHTTQIKRPLKFVSSEKNYFFFAIKFNKDVSNLLLTLVNEIYFEQERTKKY